jgi:anti-sigma28 factor (negative regulator of flagellin synthesis)
MRLQLDTAIGTQLTGTSGSAAAAAPAKSGAANAASVAATGGDSSSLSGTANLLSRLASDRASRIAQLTTSVRDGSYKVPSAAISRAIVEEALS